MSQNFVAFSELINESSSWILIGLQKNMIGCKIKFTARIAILTIYTYSSDKYAKSNFDTKPDQIYDWSTYFTLTYMNLT